MADFPFGLLLLLLFAVLLAYRSTAIVAENERCAVFLLGRFQAFKGPGLVFKTSNHHIVRLTVGDVGSVISPEFIRFGEVDIPVTMAGSFNIGDAVRIDSFGDSGPIVSQSSIRPKRICPNCGHSVQ
jgi:hypothetical protein